MSCNGNQYGKERGQPRRIASMALLLIVLHGTALAAPVGADSDPVFAWSSGDVQLDPRDPRLARADGQRFSLRVRLRVPRGADATIVELQAPDRKSGFRLFTKDATSAPSLSF